MLNKLKRIFNFYRKKIKFKTNLLFDISGIEQSYFDIGENSIHFYNKKAIENKAVMWDIIDFCGITKREDTIIYILLHEIKHAIDYKNSEQKFLKEVRKISNKYYYMSDTSYWLSFPFEKRANDFAKRELKKWIKT